MADDQPINENGEDLPDNQKNQKKVAKYDSGAADLEKVTDYAEEKEIYTQDVANAISAIGDRRNKDALEKQAREKELLKVSIKKEDVDLISLYMVETTTIDYTYKYSWQRCVRRKIIFDGKFH
ncbi:unnamed protein product [Phyllotreta striolata]|uniref:Nascent polypeptide-associated complex subunit alpha-like UBA domain-containing protein n=1 Tax=Phyllotreta striolata TaxID=444603 RepID=A0A9N9TKN0_PHYSR|nr:unnamed protein product [Phyllotreta striolata]